MRPRKTLKALSILLSAFLMSSAHAIVNIEEMRGKPQQDGWSGNVSVSVSGDSGNTDKTGASTDVQLYWRRAHITRLIAASYSYGENSRARDTNKGFIHLRHITQQTPGMALEVFTQATRNEFSRLSLRTLLGAGTRLTLHEKNTTDSAYLGLGAFYLSETLEKRAGLSDDGTKKFWRANLYLALRYRFNDYTRIASTTYYQPALDNGDDYRILEEGNLKVKLSDTLALKLTIEITHDSEPPQSIENTDISYKTGIEYQF